MEFRDYYKLLGVERTAGADQIKSAYRRLARKFHPDVSKVANAEARFKEVQEAYEVLKDPEKRAAYDQLGSDWKAGQQFRAPPDFGSGYEFDGAPPRSGRGRARAAPADGGASEEDYSEFFSSLFGRGTPFGAGGMPGGRDHHARIDIELEEAYSGTTRTLELQRPEVKPDGTVELRRHAVRVTIPAGVTQGQLIRLAGQGSPSHGKAPAGDLYLEANILPNRQYQLDGRDVTVTLAVAPWEAALGATITAPTLGGPVDMRIPPGSQAGQKLRLRGRGLPGNPAGDEYLQLKVVLPRADTPQAKALYEEMRDKLNFNPRAG
ncbi:MAG: DnaJ domain-containing protein [Proteobacteria bacterium]|nr:DnaJ domain-containing protein [Pseudomonadota bacterium]